MTRVDGRTLDHKTLEHLRHLAVQRVLHGEHPSDVMKSLGFYRTGIYKWLRAYCRRRKKALARRKGVIRFGNDAVISNVDGVVEGSPTLLKERR